MSGVLKSPEAQATIHVPDNDFTHKAGEFPLWTNPVLAFEGSVQDGALSGTLTRTVQKQDDLFLSGT
ncbi:MAG: hypothetical protein WCP21_17790, partial [Armatimonadota bacterium]